MCLVHGHRNYGRKGSESLTHSSLNSPSHTHLSVLRPPLCPPIALYRPHHPPTRWHLHRVTTVTAILSHAVHTCTHIWYCMHRFSCSHFLANFVHRHLKEISGFVFYKSSLMLQFGHTHSHMTGRGVIQGKPVFVNLTTSAPWPLSGLQKKLSPVSNLQTPCPVLSCLIPDSPVTFTMKQTVSLPTLVQAYRPESLGVASRICSTSCSIRVRLLMPRELPSLVQVMVPVSGRGQLSFNTSPGCTEHTVGLEIWYLFDASAERMGGVGRGG